jgi:hypothetical protein
MPMTDECRPPEHLRDRDGWHWVETPLREPHLARWHAAERGDVEPLWTSTHHVCAGTPRYVVREWGWRYLAPVAPPDLVRELVEALEAMQAAVKDLPPSSVVRLSDDLVTRLLRADGRATDALHRAKEAGV